MLKKTELHILMVTESKGDGWKHAVALIEGWQVLGTTVTLITVGAVPSLEKQKQIAAFKNVNLKITDFRSESTFGADEDLAAATKFIAKTAQEVNADVLHLHTYSFASAAVNIPKVTTLHTCAISRMRAAENSFHPEFIADYFSRVRTGIMQTDVVVAPSNAVLHEFTYLYGKHPHQAVIANGIKSTGSAHTGKAAMVLFSGAEPQLQQSAATLNSESGGWPSYFINAGKIKENLATGLLHLHGTGAVKKKELISRAAIYVGVSNHDPYAFEVLQAAAAGCALVLNDMPVYRELWHNAAFFYDQNEPAALNKILAQLKSDSHLRNSYAEKAKARVNEYNQANMCRAYLNLFRQLRNQSFQSPVSNFYMDNIILS